MRDEAFEMFIEEFGEATHRTELADETIDRWRGKLPEKLLEYWKEEGWCGYANGLFWTVDPEDYEDVVDAWLEDTPLEKIDTFHVIGRSAFGGLYLCGEKSGNSVTILCAVNGIIALRKELRPKTPEMKDLSIESLFTGYKSDFDLNDEHGHPMFERARSKLGDLGPDEIYGFEPAVALGGRMIVENLRKVKLHQHLMILRQLAPPAMPFADIDIDKLLSD